MKNFTDAVITGHQRNTEDSIVVELQLAKKISFKSGQHLTLGARIEGRKVYRTYSICTPGGETDKVGLGIRVLHNGLFSPWLAHCRVGDHLEVSSPSGIFYLRAPLVSNQENLFIAAGSGITPILAMVEDFLVNHSDTRAILLYGNQSLRRTMFLDQLMQLKNRFLSRLEIHFFTSQEKQELAWRSARIDNNTLSDIIEKKIIRLKTIKAVYLCGPEAMMTECHDFFLANRVNPQAIFSEHFTAAKDGGKIIKRKSLEGKTLAEVRVVLGGVEQKFDFKEDDDNLLQATRRNGLNPPYACTGGMCGTCRARILEGKAEMTMNYALDDEDMKKKFILTCQARPTTPVVKLSFDY